MPQRYTFVDVEMLAIPGVVHQKPETSIGDSVTICTQQDVCPLAMNLSSRQHHSIKLWKSRNVFKCLILDGYLSRPNAFRFVELLKCDNPLPSTFPSEQRRYNNP